MRWYKAFCILLVMLCSFHCACGETLYDYYTLSQVDQINLENGLTVSVWKSPSEIESILLSESDQPDIFVFSLPAEGLDHLLDQNCVANLSTSDSLHSLLSQMPTVLTDKLSRNEQLLAVPIFLEVHTSQLLTTTDALLQCNLSIDDIPTTTIDLFEAAYNWYGSDQMDGINLLQSYASREMIVYYALQQYIITHTTHDATPDYNDPSLKKILQDALLLADMMEAHGAFSQDAPSLFISAAANTGFNSTSEQKNLDLLDYANLTGEMIVCSFRLTQESPAINYFSGLVAVANPHSDKLEQAVRYLSEELDRLPAATLDLLNSTSNSQAISIHSEYLTELSATGILLTLANQLVNGNITLEQCVEQLQR